jgi:hypothetical protein
MEELEREDERDYQKEGLGITSRVLKSQKEEMGKENCRRIPC